MLAASAHAQQTPAATPKPAPATKAPAAKAPAGSASQAGKAPTAAGKTPAAKSPGAVTLDSPKAKASYAIGLNIGKGMNRSSVEVDTDVFMQGLKDGLSGGKALMTDEELKTELDQLQAHLRQVAEEKAKELGDANKKEGDEFLAANKTKEGVVALPDGLQYKILTAGTGPKPTASDMVVCNYKGTLINGTEFDSSYKRGQPATFAVSQVIRGWSEAVQLMPVGSKWQIFIPGELAYGPRGAGPDIGPNATLIFEVELISIQAKPAAAAPVAPAAPPVPAGKP
ncbi:MAG: FKBP-type peptidyl-prolyl cis-trans isomerase [Acidobacteriia bacterium]|nr:FKBP-type peptidyl-prolyl cis-trans isomerase [Terriglobia bacterium]